MKNNFQNFLITGCTGFIGFNLTNYLLNKKLNVLGIDITGKENKKLKKARLDILSKHKNFTYLNIDINSQNFKTKKFKKGIECIVHLAAKPGVRDSFLYPEKYFKSNISGFFNILELSKKISCKHLLYASSSSVYGNQEKFPINEEMNTNNPLSFYAASKKSNEIMAYSYSSMYKIPITGLRLFTVYGPYGRPDMSMYKFTKLIHSNKSIQVFNKGKHSRDFTYIDDAIFYINELIASPPKGDIPHEIYNIGNNQPTSIIKFIGLIEKYLNKKSVKNYLPLQAGDVLKTSSSTNKLKKKIGYLKKTNLENGIKKFIEWFNLFH